MSDGERWYVFAKTMVQFKLFCKVHGKRLVDCTFIDSSEKLRGISKDSQLIFLPDFRMNVSLWWQGSDRVWDCIGQFKNKKYAPSMNPEIPFVPYEVP
jgi:hypothetical protein